MATNDMTKNAADFVDKVITTALGSGSLKLIGPSQSIDQAKKNAAIDAAYLLELVNHMTSSLEQRAEGQAREVLSAPSQEVTPAKGSAYPSTGQRQVR